MNKKKKKLTNDFVDSSYSGCLHLVYLIYHHPTDEKEVVNGEGFDLISQKSREMYVQLKSMCC